MSIQGSGAEARIICDVCKCAAGGVKGKLLSLVARYWGNKVKLIPALDGRRTSHAHMECIVKKVIHS